MGASVHACVREREREAQSTRTLEHWTLEQYHKTIGDENWRGEERHRDVRGEEKRAEREKRRGE